MGKTSLAAFVSVCPNLDTLKILAAGSDSEKALMLEASKFNQVITNAYEEKAPHKICRIPAGRLWKCVKITMPVPKR